MPTPFQHLAYAKALLGDPALPEVVRERLWAQRGDFLLGNTAGDVQAVSGQPRPETHFYVFPPRGRPRAWRAMLEQYPALTARDALSPAQIAFVSGYIAHLIWDEVWAWEVFIPCYIESGIWETPLERNMHHNARRVLLDREAQRELRAWPPLVPALRASNPADWLPFVSDVALRQWRDWLVEQLASRATGETAAVFAARMGVPVAELEALAEQVAAGRDDLLLADFDGALARYTARGHAESREAIICYWQMVA